MSTAVQRTPEQKRVKITSKRQFTIPQEFYKKLGFHRDAICTMGDGMLIIQPATDVSGGDFSEQICSLTDPNVQMTSVSHDAFILTVKGAALF